MKVICLGSAACMGHDLDCAADMGIVPGVGWELVAVNKAAETWPGEVDHWVTIHAELLPMWLRARQQAGRPAPGRFWTGNQRAQPPGIELSRAANWGGSSGLLAVSVALQLGATKVVLCGIPLDHEQGHFDNPEKLWRDAVNYRRGWTDHQTDMRNVRSFNGWTRDLLGEPTQAWLTRDPEPLPFYAPPQGRHHAKHVPGRVRRR